MKETIILASASPRRRDLLAAVGFPFRAEVSHIDEASVLKGKSDLSCKETVITLASAKADEVAQRFPHNWVLGADTIVALDGEIFGKPTDTEDAVKILTTLAGREHSVWTGICLISPNGAKFADAEETHVKFRNLTREEITAYLSCGESMDKAGAYGIQRFGALLCERICGDYTNIVGLPLPLLSRGLAALGISLKKQWSD